MLILIIGAMGSGKTLLGTYFALKSKTEVYANYFLDLPNYKPLEVIDLLELPNHVLVIIDEGYTWLESRTSGFFLNRYLSYIVLQSRKRGIDIMVTAQLYSSIDVRFREQADIIVKCERLERGFHYSFLNVGNWNITKFFLPEESAKKYYSKYDTYQIVEPHTKETLERKILETKGELLWEKAVEIGEDIKEYFNSDRRRKITHPRVKAQLLKKGHNLEYESLVYLYLKDFFDDD